MIDSHCHLDLLENPKQLLSENGLSGVITVGTTPPGARAALALCAELERVWAVVGLHPNEVEADGAAARAELEELVQHPSVVGIGEAGLDDHWGREQHEAQLSSLLWQLDLAGRTHKTCVLHIRDGEDDRASRSCAEVLRDKKPERAVLHCFNGHPALLEVALELGYFLGFAGNLTYKSAGRLREVAASAPLDRLLLETDSPYLSPVPHRGQPNRPGLARLTLQRLSELRGIAEAELEIQMDHNAERAYALVG
jgi:TatD DNase family protein